MEDKIQKIPKNLLNKEYIKKLFNSKIKDINIDAKNISEIIVYPIKERYNKRNFHLVIMYNLILNTKNKLQKKCKVVCSAHSSKSRKKMFEAMELIYKKGFDKGQITLPKPLWYITDLKSIFYIGIEGHNILENIKKGKDVFINLKRSAEFLAKLHQIKIPKKINLEKYFFDWKFLDPANILNLPKNKKNPLVKQIYKQYKMIKEKFKEVNKIKGELSHGDFHLENILIPKGEHEKITILDFSEVCIAPFTYDIGSFLQQLHFMSFGYVSNETYQTWKGEILNDYLKIRKIKLNQNIINQINLFRAWLALRSAIYFLGFDVDNEINPDFLVKQVNYYLNLFNKNEI
ncbi:MAG: aminoglycoside phosphotransferase family protein [Patescibacteria group bacterium]